MGEGKDKIIQTLIKPGNPWHIHATEMVEAFECLALAEKFGWTDEYILNFREHNPDRYYMYVSMLKGLGMSEKKD